MSTPTVRLLKPSSNGHLVDNLSAATTGVLRPLSSSWSSAGVVTDSGERSPTLRKLFTYSIAAASAAILGAVGYVIYRSFKPKPPQDTLLSKKISDDELERNLIRMKRSKEEIEEVITIYDITSDHR